MTYIHGLLSQSGGFIPMPRVESSKPFEQCFAGLLIELREAWILEAVQIFKMHRLEAISAVNANLLNGTADKWRSAALAAELEMRLIFKGAKS